MNKEKIQKIGTEWKALDEIYDNIVQGLIDRTESIPLSPERLSELKEMQNRLFDLEVELYKTIQEG